MTARQKRIIRVQERELDPIEPPKFKVKRNSEAMVVHEDFVPVMANKAKKLTEEERDFWFVPQASSNWKNPTGKIHSLEERIKTDRYGKKKLKPSSKFALFAEALDSAADHVKEERVLRKQIEEDTLIHSKTLSDFETLRKAQEEHEKLTKKKSHSSTDDNDDEKPTDSENGEDDGSTTHGSTTPSKT